MVFNKSNYMQFVSKKNTCTWGIKYSAGNVANLLLNPNA